VPANELEVTIGSLLLNQNLTTTSFYVLKNTPEILSTLSTRKTDSAKQADHGTEDSLSYYGARILPFEGEMWSTSQSARVTMEKALKEELALPVAQAYDDADGYLLVLITDEDGLSKQLYAKVLEPPKIELMDTALVEARKFSFVLYAKDPALYSQTLTTVTGPESYTFTTMTLQDDALPELKDGALPELQDDTGAEMTGTNSGNWGTAPVITLTGPLENPVVGNSTTGKSMDFSGGAGVSLAAGDTLEIDVAAKTATKTSGVTETDVTGNLTTTSEWIFIEPGANILTIFDETPDDLTGQMSVSFRSTWI